MKISPQTETNWWWRQRQTCLLFFLRVCECVCECVFSAAMCSTPGTHLHFRIWDELGCARLCLSPDLGSLPTGASHFWEMRLLFWQVTGTHTWTRVRAQMGARLGGSWCDVPLRTAGEGGSRRGAGRWISCLFKKIIQRGGSCVSQAWYRCHNASI